MDGVAWGRDVLRRSTRPPFLVYEPRLHHAAHLLAEAERWADRDFLVQGPRRLTYRQVLDAVPHVAARLRAAGLEPGERLLLLAGNSPEWVVALLAAFHADAVPVPGGTSWSAAEVRHVVRLTDPAVVVVDERSRPLLDPSSRALVLDVATLRTWAEAPGPERLPLPAGDPDREDEPAVVLPTAGTTGAAKAVALAHRSVVLNLHALLDVAGRLPHELDLSRPPTVTLLSGPLFHVGGLQPLLLSLLTASTVVFLSSGFDAREVLDLLERERVRVWGAVPTMVVRVLAEPSLPGRDLASLRSVSLGGAPVSPRLLERMRAAFPQAARGVSTVYGLTEAGGTITSASGALMVDHPDTAGRPVPLAEVRVLAPGPDGCGEIVVRTPSQMLGYWGGSAAGLLDQDGWLHTGDVGRVEGGLLYLTGRSKDVVIRGGENVAAAHVEAALGTHPGVAAAAVVALPDDEYGEVVAAAVQVHEGTSVAVEELRAHVSGLLAGFEVPTQWWLLTDDLPVSASGKVDKRAVRAGWPLA
ncbi:MAG: AMP-binding enzyme family protein [Frankiales bacterium]|nr:AMP-binding enzyme family protein [Frankiales bacterium]